MISTHTGNFKAGNFNEELLSINYSITALML